MTLRRAQSVRHTAHTQSLALSSDEIANLRQDPSESDNDVLRRQLILADKSKDALLAQIHALQLQLSQRPPLEHYQKLEKEHKELDLLLQGTMRENERAMNDLQRSKEREKVLERALAKFAGDNWADRADVDLASPPPQPVDTAQSALHSTGSAYTEQVRLLVLGMEERLRSRETELTSAIERAEIQSKLAEEMRTTVIN